MKIRHQLPSASSLFAFEAAARHGNFSRAAEELNITQPAVSHAVSTLEKHLGQKLFTRQGPRLMLTEHGERLGRTTTHAFASIEHVLDVITATATDREVVTLSISSGMATHWLMPRYASFRESFPDTDLQFKLLPGSVRGPLFDCDLGLRVADSETKRNLDGWFAPERIMAVCSPGYYTEYGSFENPKKPHILVSLPEYWLDWPEFAAQLGGPLDLSFKRLTFPDYSVVVHTALSGQGIALGWTSVVSRLLLEGSLVKASAGFIQTDQNYHMVMSNRRAGRPIVVAVRDWIVEQMRQEENQLKATIL